MNFDHEHLPLLADALKVLEGGFPSLPDLAHPTDNTAIADVLGEVAVRLHDNYP
jgi:hypothetical protein